MFQAGQVKIPVLGPDGATDTLSQKGHPGVGWALAST